MKNIVSTLLVTAVIATAALVAGCSTASSGGSSASTTTNAPAVNPTVTALEQTVITSAAQDATILVLNKNPNYRADFEAGNAVLGLLATGTNQINAATVDAALQQVGETNQVVNMVILNGVTALNAYAASTGGSAPGQNKTITTGIGWINTGIAAGLGE